ncbi:MAG TPA: DUF2970 domain-containing protein [Pseudomonadaceae bacterium]|nr:DUF2970 domain-containing protein [Pseudomonadaceae bacterium]
MNDSNNTPHQREPAEDRKEKHGFFDVLKSVLWGALGVQSNKNREKDFQHGSLKVFMVAGTIFTVVFILVVMTVVKLALRNTGL